MALHRLPGTAETVRVGIFDRSFPPVLAVESDDEVILETVNHWGDRVTPDTTIEDVIRLRTEEFPHVGPHSLTGPIEVRKAQPGDVLKVDILNLVPRRHGFTLHLPQSFGTGLLPNDFPVGSIRHFDHDLESRTVMFKPQVRIPLRPFLGILGNAPAEPGSHSSVPPGPHGGNLDLPELREGATLYLPVFVPGALFSAGDAHSAQGHGEVCLTAIETAMEQAHLRFTLIEGMALASPRAETPDAWITLGFHEDLLEATRSAVRDMINLLEGVYGLAADEAYALCSIAVDLSVTQVVNQTCGIHARLPKALFS